MQLGHNDDSNYRSQMLSKILQSNSPLSGDCRARLLNLRTRQKLELDSIKDAIELDQASIAEIKEAISGIKDATKLSKTALAIYDTNMKALKESKSRVMPLSSPHNEGSRPVEENLSPTYRRAHALIASGASSELRHVEQQEKDLQTQTLNLRSLLSSLEKELHDSNVELALSERSLAVHTTSMQGTSSTLEALRKVLSPIKHVPYEVWEEIFRIVAANVRGKRARVLPLSRVCREWRAIFLGLTQLRTRIAIHPFPWWPQVEIDRFRMLLSRANGSHATLLVHFHSTQNWESQALASELLGSLYLHREHVYYEEEEENPSIYRVASQSHGWRIQPWGSQPSGWGSPTKPSREIQMFEPTYQHGYSGTERLDLITVPPSLLPQQYSVHFYVGHKSNPVEQRPLSIPFNTPQSITIEAPIPRQVPLLNILSSFNKVSRLTLLNVSPETPNQLIDKLQEVKYLRFSSTMMVPFQISPLISLSIEELHVEHGGDNTFPQLAGIIELPKLHTLAITLHEHSLCSMLGFPTLRTLILHSSAPARDLASALDFFKSKSHFGRINHLRFCDWDGVDSSSTVIDIVKNVTMAAMHLTELTFTNCRLEMSSLISVVTSDISSLKIINLACCVGITRSDCESLRLKVERLTISV